MPLRPLSSLVLTGALALAANTTADAQPHRASAVETLASYPHGAFLENLTVAPDQTVFFTSYFAETIMALAPKGEARAFAPLDAHPVGIIRTPTGFIATAHRIPFTQAPDFLSSNEILVIGLDGRVKKTIPAPDARFLNGLVQIAPDMVLIADSVAGCIWAFTPSTGSLRVWLKDSLLAQDPAATASRPGANGLKLQGRVLYVSNSSRGALYRVSMNESGAPIGAPSLFVQPGPIDDFTITARGVIFATTHGESLLRIGADGAVTTVLKTGCDSCTSVAPVRRHGRTELIILTTGNFVEGGSQPARVLAIPIPR